MLDTRREILALLGRLEFSSGRRALKAAGCFALAGVVAFAPEHAGLSEAARRVLFILVSAAGLWITEAIPAFAVALLVIALEIALLGEPGGVYATSAGDWERFVHPWASPLIWLFLGGFVLADAAAKTGLDRWLTAAVLRKFGGRPSLLLLAVMAVTFMFSMFVSNTATAVMMLAVLAPVTRALPSSDPFGKGLLLAVPFAANLGGMGSLIGTPPNAIAAGALSHTTPVTFAWWMLVGLPPAIVLAGVMWGYLVWRYPCAAGHIDVSDIDTATTPHIQLPMWKRLLVMGVFIATVVLWLTGPLHGIPTPVVSFLPISIFAAAGVIGAEDIRGLHWDVLLLIAGGLALGYGVSETGLAAWMVEKLPEGLAGTRMAIVMSYLTSAMSNFMSNTAAANLLVPVGVAAGGVNALEVVVPIALGASVAMCLPISTPPNAVAYTSGKLTVRDFLWGGLLMGILGPGISVLWCWFVI